MNVIAGSADERIALLDTLVWASTNLWVEDSIRGLFVMLFGASAGMLLSEKRLGRGAIRSVDLDFRRNLWLMAFGAVHTYLLLAPHDVLYVYGLLGLLVFPLRRVQPLLLSALGIALVSAAAMIHADGTPRQQGPDEPRLYQQRATVEGGAAFRHGLKADMEEDVETYLSGYLQIFNAQKEPAVEAQSIDIYKGQSFLVGGMMLIGMALFGVLERYELALVCVSVWLVQILFSLWWRQHFRHGPIEWAWRVATRWELIPSGLARVSGSLAAGHERAGA